MIETAKHSESASRLTRRGVLTGMGGAVLLIGGAWTPFTGLESTTGSVSDQAYDELRRVWREMLIGGAVDPADPRIVAAIGRLDDDAIDFYTLLDRSNKHQVFTDLPFTAESSITNTYSRLSTMATAYNTAGSALEGDTAVLEEILAGLQTTHDEVYHPGQTETGNWWHWEIGATRSLGDVCTLVYEYLAAEELADYLAAIDYFAADPYYQYIDPQRRTLSAGANRIDLCRAVAVRGVLGRNDPKISRARDGISDVLAYVDSGDGFYRDGSFVQHGTVAYTGTYGVVLLDGASRLIRLLADSPWEVVDPNRQILFDAVDITFAPVIFDNQMMDFVRGRAISRFDQSDRNYARQAVEHILRLADGVAVGDPQTADRWRGLCKGWLSRDTFEDVFVEAGMPRTVAYADLLDDAAIAPIAEPTGFTMLAGMDRAVHRRPGWAYAIAMASTRIAYYEAGNGENDRGFHTGEGMTYLYNADSGQFADGFWPTVDVYRLPGTTVDSKPLPDKAGGEWGAARPPSATWVGGASLRGTHGAVGMQLEGIQSSLRARKSWFCLADLVVALGAGITGGSDHPVETVVDNRNLHADGDHALLLDGVAQSVTQGWSTQRKVRYAHVEGVGGYAFPRGGQLHALREERTGSWRDVNKSGPTEPITRRYLSLWFDHGVGPENASYAYILAPNATAERTRRLAEAGRGDIQILSNTPELQAVRARDLGVTAVNFWGSGELNGVTLHPAGDAYANDGQHADTNFGSGKRLLVKHVQTPDSGYSRQSYLAFELDSVAMAPEEVASATLYFRARVNDGGGSESAVDVHAIGDDWQEDSLTWNARPSLNDRLGSVQIDGVWQWRSIDLTDHVLAQLRGDRRASFALRQDPAAGNGLSVEIASREDAAVSPYLHVEPKTEPGEIAGITVNAPCSLLAQEDGSGSLTLAVSDPTQDLAELHVTLSASGYRTWSGDETVRVNDLESPIKIVIDTEGSLGATHSVTFGR